jgi:hypothetical protein
MKQEYLRSYSVGDPDDPKIYRIRLLNSAPVQTEVTAAPTTQRDRKLSPLKVSVKREFLWFWLETLAGFSLKLRLLGVWRLTSSARKAL